MSRTRPAVVRPKPLPRKNTISNTNLLARQTLHQMQIEVLRLMSYGWTLERIKAQIDRMAENEIN